MPWFIFSHMFSQCDGQQVTLMWAYVLSDTPLQLQACGQKEPLHQSHLTRMATGVSTSRQEKDSIQNLITR